MLKFSQISRMEMIGPVVVGVYLTDPASRTSAGPFVLSPNDFITDFSTFVAALRAEGFVESIDAAALKRSWQKHRRVLRRELVARDTWDLQPLPPADLEGRLVCGRAHDDI